MKFIKPFAVALLLVLGGFVSLYAQSRELSGTVLDSQQQPIIGAAVILTGALLQMLKKLYPFQL